MRSENDAPGVSAAIREGRFSDALRILNSSGSRNIETQILRARLLALVGRVTDAERTIGAVSDLSTPSSASAALTRGIIAVERAHFESAAIWFQRAAAIADHIGDQRRGCESR